MRVLRVLSSVAAAAALGCGSSSSSVPATLTAVIGGHTFNPGEVVFVPEKSATCNFAGTPVPLTAMVLGLSETTGACGLLQMPCAGRASFRLSVAAVGLGILPWSGNPTPAAQQLEPGDYRVYDSTADLQALELAALTAHKIQASFAATESTDATCHFPADPTALKGNIHIDSISATQVTGTIDATAAMGDSVRGPFTASACAVPGFDPCSMLANVGTGAWVPLSCAAGLTCSP
jgi:hypothetical protein